MSLNNYTLPGINPILASRLSITNLSIASVQPPVAVTLTVSDILHGLVTSVDGARAAILVLNLPTAAILIGSQALNGVQEGNTFPLIIRNQDATHTVDLTASAGNTIDPAGGGVVATATNRSFLIRIDDVTPGSENYTVFDVTDTGAQI